MPRQFHPKNASFFQLGLGACFPFHGSVVGLYVITFAIIFRNDFLIKTFAKTTAIKQKERAG